MARNTYSATTDEKRNWTTVDLAQRIAEIVEDRPEDSEEFKNEIKRACNTARACGLTEEEIRTQLGAKADAMQAALEAAEADS